MLTGHSQTHALYTLILHTHCFGADAWACLVGGLEGVAVASGLHVLIAVQRQPHRTPQVPRRHRRRAAAPWPQHPLGVLQISCKAVACGLHLQAFSARLKNTKLLQSWRMRQHCSNAWANQAMS